MLELAQYKKGPNRLELSIRNSKHEFKPKILSVGQKFIPPWALKVTSCQILKRKMLPGADNFQIIGDAKIFYWGCLYPAH